MTTETVITHDCPGEEGFECSGPIRAKGLCQRCYHRSYMRRYYAQNRDKVLDFQRHWREENHDQILEAKRRYRKENRDKIREQRRRHYEENRDKVLARNRRWLEEHPEEVRERKRRWQRANPENVAARSRLRRARKRNALHIPFTDAELTARLSMFAGCWMCGAEADTIDHLIPLVRGGPHCLSNLRPACGSCNATKGAKTPQEWAEVQDL